MDLVSHHSLINRTITTAWGAMVDGGYFWHYNELWLGGAGAPGEKAWEIALIPVVFCARLAAAIGFLQMKRWGQQWLIVTCWMGVIVWIGYNTNMTIYGRHPLRARHVSRYGAGGSTTSCSSRHFWRFPYLHTVNREIFRT